MFTNAQKLSAVVSEWIRPAITQIASSKLSDIPFLQNLSSTIGGTGLVGQNYNIIADIQPLINPVVNALVEPMLAKYISNIPDEAIPLVARNVVNELKQQGTLSILDGLITLEQSDFDELDSLLLKNLPVEDSGKYNVIH